MKTSLTKMEDRRENIDFNMQQIINADRFQEEVRENLRKGSMAMKSCIDNKLTGKIEKSYETVEQCLLRKKLEKEQREQNGLANTFEPVLNKDRIDQMFFIKGHPDGNKVSKTNIPSRLVIPKFEPKPLDPRRSLYFVSFDKVKQNEKIPQTTVPAFSKQLAFSESRRQSHASNPGILLPKRRNSRPYSATFYSPENLKRSMIGLKEIPILLNEIESKVNLLYHIAYNDLSSTVFISGYQNVIFSYKNLPSSKSLCLNPTWLCVGTEPLGLTVTMQNTIVYTDRMYGVVELFLNDEEAPYIKARIIFQRRKNELWGVNCTKNGTYLVCMTSETDVSAVVHFCVKGTIYKEFTDNSKGELLFERPRYVCVNETNQNICVSDFKRGIIVLNHLGQLIVNYRGNKIICGKPFSPRGIACDRLGRILVADTDNDVVHLLESNGEFITYILSSISPISQPWGLCVDS